MNREIIEKYPDSKIKKVRFIEDESNPRVTTEITYKENGKKDECATRSGLLSGHRDYSIHSSRSKSFQNSTRIRL